MLYKLTKSWLNLIMINVVAMQAYQVLVKPNMINVVAMQAYQVVIKANMINAVAMQAYRVLVKPDNYDKCRSNAGLPSPGLT